MIIPKSHEICLIKIRSKIDTDFNYNLHLLIRKSEHDHIAPRTHIGSYRQLIEFVKNDKIPLEAKLDSVLLHIRKQFEDKFIPIRIVYDVDYDKFHYKNKKITKIDIIESLRSTAIHKFVSEIEEIIPYSLEIKYDDWLKIKTIAQKYNKEYKLKSIDKADLVSINDYLETKREVLLDGYNEFFYAHVDDLIARLEKLNILRLCPQCAVSCIGRLRHLRVTKNTETDRELSDHNWNKMLKCKKCTKKEQNKRARVEKERKKKKR